jgi:lipopolysaccharide biosynthesis glycosyltransferase
MEYTTSNNSHFDIVFCLDCNYVKPTLVTIRSILQTNNNLFFSFHIISDYLTNDLIDEIKKLTATNKSEIFFYMIDSTIFKKLPTKEHISILTYFRFVIPGVLPQNIKKVLYLDGDLIVVDSLSEFLNTEIDDYSLITALSTGDDDLVCLKRLNIQSHYGYFCAGVLLINLEYWRKQNICEKLIECVSNSPPGFLALHDQDALNIILHKTKKTISARWNLTNTFFMHKYIWNSISSNKQAEKDIDCAVNNPAIIHFVGAIKPWYYECTHPYKICWDLFNSECSELQIMKKRYFSNNWTGLLKYFIKKILNYKDKRYKAKYYSKARSLYEKLSTALKEH